MKYSSLLFLSFLFLANIVLVAQGTNQVQFGKNRVQFHKDFEEWSEYESDNFVTYWYGEARYIGQAAVVMAEYDFAEIQNFLEHRMNEKLEIIVYSDLTDLKQNNIGSEEAFENVVGQTKTVENKLFVYFNGDHNHLRQQIRQGIAAIYIDAMLFGSNLQEIVQNAVLLDLPEWYKQGLVAYVGEEWNTDLDSQLREVFATPQFKDFEDFAIEYPILAGHSLWYYVGLKYGTRNLSDILYLTRINRNLESGFLFVLGISFEKVLLQWQDYFQARYQEELKNGESPEGKALTIKNRRQSPILQVKVSPNGQHIAYVINELGKSKVYLHHVATDKREVIFTEGYRNIFQATDYGYPMLAWSPSSFELAVLYEQRDQPKLIRYDINLKKTFKEDLTPQLQRVHSMDYVDLQTMVITATSRGFSDVYLYFINSRQPQAITKDYYDDLDAKFVQIGNRKGIIWASNRPDSILTSAKMDSLPPIQNYDLFYFDLETRSNELIRLTHTPYSNERQPIYMDSTYFSFLSDENGIYNRQIGYLEDYISHFEQVIVFSSGEEIVIHADSTYQIIDSSTLDTSYFRPVIKQKAINHLVTNYKNSILEQSQATRRNTLAQLVQEGRDYKILVDTLNTEKRITKPFFTYHRAAIAQRDKEMPIEKSILDIKTNARSPIIEVKPTIKDTIPQQQEPIEKKEKESSNYYFQSEFDEKQEETIKEVEQETPTIETVPTVEPPVEAIPEPIKEETLADFELPAFDPSLTPKTTTSAKGVYDFKPGRITPYRLRFRTDYFTTEMNNDQLFGGLNSFSGIPQDFGYPPPGILTKVNFKDLLEDYVIEAGVRVPTSFNGYEYYFLFDDKKTRLDKRYAFYRRMLRFPAEQARGFDGRRIEVQNIVGQFSVRYPFDIYRSIRATSTLRVDVTTPLATDSVILNVPTSREQRLGLGVEYVFDNTLDVALNIKNGTRYKLYAELVKQFDVDLVGSEGLDVKDGFMTILGLDFRHYQRLDKKSIFALRVAGATTFGREQILFRIGGTDNWIFPSLNENIPQPTEGNFSYRQDISNLRGFPLNIRNGTSFALINNEFRIPIFRYLWKQPSSFFRNFQAVGFFDVGTAWTGPSPFTEESPLNTSTFSNGPVTVKVNYFRDPIVLGYGYGVRMILFGYFIRLDRAWGIETRVVQEPRWFVSIGTDF